MPAVALALVLVALVFGAVGIFHANREHRTPPELRGEWWSRFECEFRAYALRNARSTDDRSTHENRRQPGETA